MSPLSLVNYFLSIYFSFYGVGCFLLGVQVLLAVLALVSSCKRNSLYKEINCVHSLSLCNAPTTLKWAIPQHIFKRNP